MKTLTTEECRGYIAIGDGENVLIKVDNDKAELATIIVRAVNNHQELIDALKNIREYAEITDLPKSVKSFLIGETTDALKQATE